MFESSPKLDTEDDNIKYDLDVRYLGELVRHIHYAAITRFVSNLFHVVALHLIQMFLPSRNRFSHCRLENHHLLS